MVKEIRKATLFHTGDDGYPLYRNPAIAALMGGSVVAFAEARRHAQDKRLGSDWAASGIAVKESPDGGETWGPLHWIDKNEDGPTHNPTPIADLNNPRILHFLYQKDYNRAFYTRTDDAGKTWTPAREITQAFMPMRKTYDWRVFATGIGHGVMLGSGRLITPVWYARGEMDPKAHRPSRVGAVYSDDGGGTWKPGELVPDILRNPSEAQILQLADGRLLMNIRNEETARRRAYAYSRDGGVTWSPPMLHPTLWEPVCCGAFVRIPASGGKTIVFTNPDSQFEYDDLQTRPDGNIKSRHHLTARLSEDDGLTWPYKRVLEEGVSGYSDVTALEDGTILSVYGCGAVDGNPFHKKCVRLAVYTTNWIKDGK